MTDHNRFDATTENLLATGVQESIFADRAATRGMIWLAFTAYRETVLGETKPATMQTHIRAAFLAQGKTGGGPSTKASQAVTIGKEFGTLFAEELASDYRTVGQFIQACFITAEASNAGTLLRLMDWAKHGNPTHTEDAKRVKKEEATTRKAEEVERMESAAQSAIALASLDLDAEVTAKAVATMTHVEHAAPDLSGLTDAALDALIEAAMVEREGRVSKLADVA